MTDRLGEALTRFAQFVADHPGVLPTKDIADIVAAARSWHALTNHDAAPIDRIADALAQARYARPRKTMLKGIQRQLRVEAYAVVDALTVTGENP